MNDRMIRLVTSDNITTQTHNRLDIINVIREDYSDELMAFFVRSATGTLLFVNARLPIEVQARAISFVRREINKCGITETGVLKKNFEYFCGGTCCRDERNSSIV
jgi:hypothetical protein